MYLEHQTLDRRFICPIGPATEREFILDWRISSHLANIVNNCLCYVQWNWILPFSLAESTSLIWSGVAVSLHFSLGGNSTGWGAILQVLPGIYSVWLLTSILSGQGGKGLQSESTNKKDFDTHYT